MKQQVIVIHGGDTFDTHEAYLRALRSCPVTLDTFRPRSDWKRSLQSTLGDQYEVLLPQMPCKDNARYTEWQIWFERLIPLLDHEVILVGHSLGAVFLAKYLAKHTIAHHIKGLLLVCAPHNNTPGIGDFCLPSSLDLLKKQTQHILLFHSTDDPVVLFTEMDMYISQLPEAKKLIFHDRQHFTQQEFPEIVSEIRLC